MHCNTDLHYPDNFTSVLTSKLYTTDRLTNMLFLMSARSAGEIPEGEKTIVYSIRKP